MTHNQQINTYYNQPRPDAPTSRQDPYPSQRQNFDPNQSNALVPYTGSQRPHFPFNSNSSTSFNPKNQRSQNYAHYREFIPQSLQPTYFGNYGYQRPQRPAYTRPKPDTFRLECLFCGKNGHVMQNYRSFRASEIQKQGRDNTRQNVTNFSKPIITEVSDSKILKRVSPVRPSIERGDTSNQAQAPKSPQHKFEPPKSYAEAVKSSILKPKGNYLFLLTTLIQMHLVCSTWEFLLNKVKHFCSTQVLALT